MANARTRVAIHTLGCKANQADSESLGLQLSLCGYQLVDSAEQAEVYVLNSCTVTGIADRKSRAFLRHIHRAHPESLVVATGCYARRAPDELRLIQGVDIVSQDTDITSLVDVLRHTMPPGPTTTTEQSHPLRTRSFVKIQDGCNSACSYCVVPRVRGREVSRSMAEVLTQVQQRVAYGYQEVVLTGTNVGRYGHDGTSLGELAAGVLAVTGVRRLRLSSLQPQDIGEHLLSLWKDQRLCRHLHLPLQSGSDGVLRRMGRRYTVEAYRRAVLLVKERIPDIAVTTDIMVGFPGESEKEHQESMALCSELDFAAIHVFPYSPRPGTPAVEMSGQVEPRVKRRRAKELLQLSRESTRRFQTHFLGRSLPVLWEGAAAQKADTWSGLTDNYIRVMATSLVPLNNVILPTRLVSLAGNKVWGQPELPLPVCERDTGRQGLTNLTPESYAGCGSASKAYCGAISSNSFCP
ncbi:MAG: tRNA (N(6)-L-threonylcarbamoyladenosine(37)-C(2))-methylthiotransferase MtaB [Chloroflexota bacterium]